MEWKEPREKLKLRAIPLSKTLPKIDPKKYEKLSKITIIIIVKINSLKLTRFEITPSQNKLFALQKFAATIIFASLTALFFLLAAHDFSGNAVVGVIAGYVGIFCGLSAMYFSMAQVLNNEYGREILPVGKAVFK